MSRLRYPPYLSDCSGIEGGITHQLGERDDPISPGFDTVEDGGELPESDAVIVKEDHTPRSQMIQNASYHAGAIPAAPVPGIQRPDHSTDLSLFQSPGQGTAHHTVGWSEEGVTQMITLENPDRPIQLPAGSQERESAKIIMAVSMDPRFEKRIVVEEGIAGIELCSQQKKGCGYPTVPEESYQFRSSCQRSVVEGDGDDLSLRIGTVEEIL